MPQTEPQRVVVYERAGELQVFTTAYDDEQVRRAFRSCIHRYGREAGVRAIDAEFLPPAALADDLSEDA